MLLLCLLLLRHLLPAPLLLLLLPLLPFAVTLCPAAKVDAGIADHCVTVHHRPCVAVAVALVAAAAAAAADAADAADAAFVSLSSLEREDPKAGPILLL
jgi:hypothetical protein